MQAEKIRQIVEEKRKKQNLSIRSLARKSEIKNHSQIIRLLNGAVSPTREILTKLCRGLECTPDERAEIFHAAGLLAPDEMEEKPAA